jgi:hypothetical protein
MKALTNKTRIDTTQMAHPIPHTLDAIIEKGPFITYARSSKL